jgi:hypothetical protein
MPAARDLRVVGIADAMREAWQRCAPFQTDAEELEFVTSGVRKRTRSEDARALAPLVLAELRAPTPRIDSSAEWVPARRVVRSDWPPAVINKMLSWYETASKHGAERVSEGRMIYGARGSGAGTRDDALDLVIILGRRGYWHPILLEGSGNVVWQGGRVEPRDWPVHAPGET